MTVPTSAEKRGRAAAFSPVSVAAPTPGNLEVLWGSPFDRVCYEVSASGLARKHRAQYDLLLTELTTGTGCTEDEIITHGQTVRSVLFFAEDRLARQGALASLVGQQQYRYHQPPVTRAF